MIRSCPIMLLRVRAINRSSREYVDTMDLWELVHALIPNITGLPAGLVPGYYIKLLWRFFVPPIRFSLFNRAVLMHELGEMFLFRGNVDAKDVYGQIPAILQTTAAGRRILVDIMDEWHAIFSSEPNPRLLEVVEEVRHAFVYGFRIVRGSKLILGIGTIRPTSVEDFVGFRN